MVLGNLCLTPKATVAVLHSSALENRARMDTQALAASSIEDIRVSEPVKKHELLLASLTLIENPHGFQ